MTMANGFQDKDAARLPTEERAMIARRARVLGPSYRLFYQRPVNLVRGEGVWLYDAEGNAFLDAYNNVASVGHGNPAVVAAVTAQMAVLNTHTRYLHEGILTYAEALTATMPRELSQVMFTCTGSEANDLALRIACHHSGGTGVIVTEHAYHGVTQAVAGFSPSLGPSVHLGAHVETVAGPDAGLPAAQIGPAFARGVAAAIARMQRHGIKPALLIVDTIFSSDGVFADPPGFLAEAVDVIRAAGGLFVADEVQPGFGRTGAAMWGFARHGVVPDLVTMGKPMGNGYPIAAMIARPDLLANFGENIRYFNTFGGSPVAAAAGQAVLDYIHQHHVMENCRTTGDYLQQELRGIAAHTDALAPPRGAGLFIGLDVLADGQPSAELASRLVNGLRDNRVLISASGPNANVLKIRPPMVFDRQNADHFLETFRKVVVEMAL